MKSYLILKNFLLNTGLDTDDLDLIKGEVRIISDHFSQGEKLQNQSCKQEGLVLVYKILTETYELNSENVKRASEALAKRGTIIGRNQKELLKKYYDYQREEALREFIDSLKNGYIDNKLDRTEIENIVKEYFQDQSEQARACFLKNWYHAKNANDKKKLGDYLFGIYSKLLNSYELRNISLKEIFTFNEKFLSKELSASSYETFKEYCMSSPAVGSMTALAKEFGEKYLALLKSEYQAKSELNALPDVMNRKYLDNNLEDYELIFDRGRDICLFPTEDFGLVHLNISQQLFDGFAGPNAFYSYLMDYIQNIYRVLDNYRVFSIKVENIYHENRNLKWDLYSKLSFFCEKFLKVKEEGFFYNPWEICADMLLCYDISLTEEEVDLLKCYYKGRISVEDLHDCLRNKGIGLDELATILEKSKYVFYGFTFTDCIVFHKNESFANPGLEFIENHTELLLVFYKYRLDSRKIPCPVCGGLKISGNSFPEIGVRSWECKNLICPERSKSNRGKRYSQKSNLMQWASHDNSEENCISKEIVKKWRKDIVKLDDDQELYKMLIKYFTFPGEKALFVNTGSEPLLAAEETGRTVQVLSPFLVLNAQSGRVYTSNVPVENINEILYEAYFDHGEYISNFKIKKKPPLDEKKQKILSGLLKDKTNLKLIHGDCFQVMANMQDEIITCAVTSPPYYNAREYSQWPNLYLYLKDMYNIIREAFRVLKKGGVFLFNIGDITDNENTVVKSTMGIKRIPLGAYIIYLFQDAGFELLDNLIWDKGEPQSNRQKNDGRFTPHYQRPLNAYEHMFIFKKPGADLILRDNYLDLLGDWYKNIILFSPVIKINYKGENKVGHTAPFPDQIPGFVANVFTKNSTDIVLDPFSGTLTSALAAAERGVVGLGIEIDSGYVKLSRDNAHARHMPLVTLEI